MPQQAKYGSSGPAANARFVVGTLAVVIFANLAAVLISGGFVVGVFGGRFTVDSPGWLLALLVVSLVVYRALSFRNESTGRFFAGILPLGAPLAAVGLVAFFAVMRAPSGPARVNSCIFYCIGVMAAFIVAWVIFGPPFPKAARVIIFAVYLATCAGLGNAACGCGSSGGLSRVGKTPTAAGNPGCSSVGLSTADNTPTTVAADRTGLLSGNGTGLAIEKVALGNDWRDAAVISPNGFLSAKILLPENAHLDFSVAAEGHGALGDAVVTLVRGGAQQELWRRSADVLPRDVWQDVSVALGDAGPGEVVFEVNGPAGGASALFANPRIWSTATPRTNVILLVEDALRADRMGIYGYARPTSPEIDLLCRRAVVFEECLAQAPWTIPSMGTILTSLYPTAHGMVAADKGLSPRLDTLAEAFSAGGYFTGAIQANPNLTPESGIAQGFNEYLMLGMKKPTARDPRRYVRAGTVNTRISEWLDRNGSRPFFLYAHYMDTHMPYVPPARFDKFGRDPSGRYSGELAYFSNEFAKLFAHLETKGLLDNTIVVLTADHGEQFWEHGAARHGNCLHGEEIHVPLIAWLPGWQTALRVKRRVRSIDIAPTLLDLAGLPRLSDAEGRSLAAAISGAPLAAAPVFGELLTFKPPGQYLVSLTSDHYRFILSNPSSDWMMRYELYDLDTDKGEYINLAGRRQGLAVAMKREVEAYIAAQKKLHSELIPEEFVFPLSKERRKMLQAIGYLSPGANAKTKR